MGLFWYIEVRKLSFFRHFFIRHFFLLFRISIFLLDNTKKVDLIEMGTRPGLQSIPHISGILLLMQLLLLQPLVDAKAETSAAVDTCSAPASPARVTDFKQETEAHEYRVSITFEGNPHHRGKGKMMRKKEKKKMKKKKKRKRQGRIPMLRGPRLTQGAGP